MKPARLCPLLVAILLTVSPGLIRGSDSEGTVVKLSDLPTAAQATIKEHQGHGKLGEIVKTIEGGEARYDVEVTKQGRTRSLVLNDKGEVTEMQVFLGETPPTIRQAIHKQVDGGRIEEITKNIEDGEISYDVEMTKNGKARTFTLDESGDLKEIQVFLDELPDPVRKALQKEVGPGKFGEINKTYEDGNILFETEITQGTKSRSLSFDSQGTLVYQEEQIALADTPEPVKKSIEAQLGDGKLISVDKVTEDGEVSFIAAFLKAGKHQSLNLSTDGKVLPDSD